VTASRQKSCALNFSSFSTLSLSITAIRLLDNYRRKRPGGDVQASRERSDGHHDRLHDTSWVRPFVHIWTGSAQSWIGLNDEAATFDGQPEDAAVLLDTAQRWFGLADGGASITMSTHPRSKRLLNRDFDPRVQHRTKRMRGSFVPGVILILTGLSRG
jgi:hypothetical protein